MNEEYLISQLTRAIDRIRIKDFGSAFDMVNEVWESLDDRVNGFEEETFGR